MKATGAEIKKFCDEWPPGDDWYIEEATFENDDGEWVLKDDEMYDVFDVGGVIIFQGNGLCPEPDEAIDFNDWFTGWKKAQTHAVVVVAIPVEDVQEFKDLCEKHGWDVSG